MLELSVEGALRDLSRHFVRQRYLWLVVVAHWRDEVATFDVDGHGLRVDNNIIITFFP